MTHSEMGNMLLRVALGVVFLAHGLLKFMVFGFDGTAGFFESLGLWGWLAYVVMSAEVLAGVALIAGFYTRIVAVLTLPILLGSIWVHAGAGWLFSNPGGGWEYPLFLTVVAVVVALTNTDRNPLA